MSQRLFDQMCCSGFEPEVVVGVATGGEFVAAAMRVPHETYVTSISVRRDSTPKKESSRLRRSLVQTLPYLLLNQLRLLEDWLLERGSREKPCEESAHARSLDQLADEVRAASATRVAVIDDAVDSGRTMNIVVSGLRRRLPMAEIRSGVITVTRPLDRVGIVPDFRLLQLTLVRFPWSMDFKG